MGFRTCCPPWPAAVGCPALPCQPLPHMCTLHCAHAIVQAPSSCTCCLHASSIILHVPSLCMIHCCARSITLLTPSSCVLHLCRHFIVTHTPSLHTHCRASSIIVHTGFTCAASCMLHHHACSVVHIPSLCMLYLHIRSVIHAPSCMLHHCVHSIVHTPLSHPPVATKDNPELGSQ